MKAKEKEYIMRIKRMETEIDDVEHDYQTLVEVLDPKFAKDATSQYKPKGEKEKLQEVFSKLKNIVLVLVQQLEGLKLEISKQSRSPEAERGSGFLHYLIAGLVMITVHVMSKACIQTNPSSIEAVVHFMTWTPLVLFIGLLNITF